MNSKCFFRLGFSISACLTALGAFALNLVPGPNSPIPIEGVNPLSIAAADLNGDGQADLVTANVTGATVSSLLNDGTGEFTEATDSPFSLSPPGGTSAAVNPHALAVGDLNADGNVDVVTVAPTTIVGITGSGSVLLGDGLGAFAFQSLLSTGSQPRDVAIGDFNGDAIPDIATVNSFIDLGVSIHIGSGTGTFTRTAESPFAAGAEPRTLAVGEFNGDGILDLAVGNFDSKDVTILLGNGSGGFSEATDSPVTLGQFAFDILVDDFDNDGNDDLAIATFTFFSVAVLLGDGTGHFTAASGSPFAMGGTDDAAAIAAGDIDGDGDTDLAAASRNGQVINVFIGDGTGTFVKSAGSPHASGDFNSVTVADFNADSMADVAAADVGASSVTVLVSGDSTAPTISILSPLNDAAYLLNESVIADFSCTDETGGSGVASCIGTVADEAAIDTATIGVKGFTVTAIDNGGNSSEQTVNYLVGYRLLGFLPPFERSKWKRGTKHPIKVALADFNSILISDAEASALSGSPCRIVFTATGAQSATGCMKYDVANKQFVFNWKITGSDAGPTTLTVTVSYPGTTQKSQLSQTVIVN